MALFIQKLRSHNLGAPTPTPKSMFDEVMGDDDDKMITPAVVRSYESEFETNGKDESIATELFNEYTEKALKHADDLLEGIDLDSPVVSPLTTGNHIMTRESN